MKNLTMFFVVGIAIFVTATVVADSVHGGNSEIVGIRQDKESQDVWEVAMKPLIKKEDVFQKYPVSKFTVKNVEKLEGWDISVYEVIKRVKDVSKPVVILKEKTIKNTKSNGLFNFQHTTEKLVVEVEKVNKIFSIKVASWYVGSYFGIILVLLIFSILASNIIFLVVYKGIIKPSFLSLTISIGITFVFAGLDNHFCNPSIVAISILIISLIIFYLVTFYLEVISVRPYKKAMFASLFIYYLMSSFAIYTVSNIKHAIIVAIVVPITVALTWKLIKNKGEKNGKSRKS